MTDKPHSRFRAGLISMPWSIFNRPSLQLGTLKSYIEEKSDIKVDTCHLYLPVADQIGIDLYTRIAHSGWAGEALFAPLLFPEMKDSAKQLFRESLGGTQRSLPDFDELTAAIESSCTSWLSTNGLADYNLVGFSVCFFQLLPSLYLARQIKKLRPDLPIVFGGSSCSGAVGLSLIEHFPEIDYLVDGEGEEALRHLCRFIAGEVTALPANIHAQDHCPKETLPSTGVKLDDLPYPDYRPYFADIHRLFPHLPFLPIIPVEFSRGCWWNKCTFCNLNLQWQNYRFKNRERMTKEIHDLASNHEALHFAFADNALPVKEADLFFKDMNESGLDFDFFAEIRGIIEPERLHLYRRGGLKTVQVGIESLSPSLLKKMRKGTTVMDTIATIKMCSASGIHLEGNLITEFPTTTDEEIAETLTNLDYLLPFPPLQAAVFFLGHGSPVHARAGDFCIQAILPHAKNQKLFPKTILHSMTMLVNSYRGNRRHQQKLWRPVTEKIAAWRDFHRQRTRNQHPPLHYMDGKTFLVIRQERPEGQPLLHRLRGLSRQIYLFCEEPRAREAILNAFPRVSSPVLENFLAEMSGKLLMFLDNDRALSLAVRSYRQ